MYLVQTNYELEGLSSALYLLSLNYLALYCKYYSLCIILFSVSNGHVDSKLLTDYLWMFCKLAKLTWSCSIVDNESTFSGTSHHLENLRFRRKKVQVVEECLKNFDKKFKFLWRHSNELIKCHTFANIKKCPSHRMKPSFPFLSPHSKPQCTTQNPLDADHATHFCLFSSAKTCLALPNFQ